MISLTGRLVKPVGPASLELDSVGSLQCGCGVSAVDPPWVSEHFGCIAACLPVSGQLATVVVCGGCNSVRTRYANCV